MSGRLVLITIVLLLMSLILAQVKNWNCTHGNINLALVYDCRHNLELQQHLFIQYLTKFETSIWNFDFRNRGDSSISFNLFLMTYGPNEMTTFEIIPWEIFHPTKFDESLLKINTSSCPQHLPIENLFNQTRDVFKYAEIIIERKLAIFVMGQNITGHVSDKNVSDWLESEQMESTDVKRLFIIINPKVKSAERGLSVIKTTSLNNADDVVKKSVDLLCNQCDSSYTGYTNGSSCYFRIGWINVKKLKEAETICSDHWSESHPMYLNSQGELNYVTSLLENDFGEYMIEYLKWRKQYCGMSLECELVNINLTFLGLVGLNVSSNNNHTELIWADGSPFVLKSDLSHNLENRNCYFLEKKYFSKQDVHDFVSTKFFWSNLYCDTFLNPPFYLWCESEMSDMRTKRITMNDFQSKKQDTYDSVSYTSLCNLFFTRLEFEVQNASCCILLQNIYYNITLVEHIQLCLSSDQILTNNGNDRETTKHENLLLKQFDPVPCDLVQSTICFPNQFVCPLVKNNNTYSIVSNDSQNDVRYLLGPNSADTNCLYQVDSQRHRIGSPNNLHLQNCERFLCPEGFVKCPDSYCIPAYLVRDIVKDCPHGEDEVSDNVETALCQGKLKFTLRNICLRQDICDTTDHCPSAINKFVCQVPCAYGYVCMSNVIRKEVGNDSTYYVSFLETTVQVYDNTNSFDITPMVYSLFPFFKLVDINFSQCKIKNLNNVLNSLDTLDVMNLDISQNDMSRKKYLSVIERMKDLQMLNVSYNENLELDNNFTFPLNLHVIDVSYTKCGNVVIKSLINLTNLRVLELRQVEPVDLSHVTGNVHLDILDLRGTELINIQDGYLSWLSIGKAFYTNDFRICCDVIRGPNITAEKCHAPRDAISTCQDLIGDPLKRVILWMVGVLSLLGNMVVVIYRLVWNRAVFKTAYGVFVVCLGVSDFIMGVYLLIIAGADLLYRNLYVLHDMYWRHSDVCKLAGILSTFSSETSTMFICLITLDRFLVIRYPFGQHRHSKTGKITSICLTLIIGVVVSVIPAVFPGWEIYSSNGMCLALPFSAGRHGGWEYSAVLFVGLNFVLFILIAFGQLAIFFAITSHKDSRVSSTRDNSRRAQDLAVAKQLFLVAVSDFCCWFPIGIMGIMSLNGYQFDLDVYAWSAILILPVNSAINPLIYTLPVIIRRIKTVDVISNMS